MNSREASRRSRQSRNTIFRNTCKDEKTRKDFEEKGKNRQLEIAAIKRSVEDIVASRMKLVSSEITAIGKIREGETIFLNRIVGFHMT